MCIFFDFCGLDFIVYLCMENDLMMLEVGCWLLVGILLVIGGL